MIPDTLTAHVCPECGDFRNPGKLVPKTRHYPYGSSAKGLCTGTFQPVIYRLESNTHYGDEGVGWDN